MEYLPLVLVVWILYRTHKNFTKFIRAHVSFYAMLKWIKSHRAIWIGAHPIGRKLAERALRSFDGILSSMPVWLRRRSSMKGTRDFIKHHLSPTPPDQKPPE